MDRDELLQGEARAWDALEAAVARVPDDRRAEEGVVPGWSTKDLVWHCGYWAGWAGGKIEAIAAGTYVDESHDDAYYDEENATINEEGRGLTWDEVHARASEMRERASAAVGRFPNSPTRPPRCSRPRASSTTKSTRRRSPRSRTAPDRYGTLAHRIVTPAAARRSSSVLKPGDVIVVP